MYLYVSLYRNECLLFCVLLLGLGVREQLSWLELVAARRQQHSRDSETTASSAIIGMHTGKLQVWIGPYIPRLPI